MCGSDAAFCQITSTTCLLFIIQNVQDSCRLSPIQSTPPDATNLDSFVGVGDVNWALGLHLLERPSRAALVVTYLQFPIHVCCPCSASPCSVSLVHCTPTSTTLTSVTHDNLVVLIIV